MKKNNELIYKTVKQLQKIPFGNEIDEIADTVAHAVNCECWERGEELFNKILKTIKKELPSLHIESTEVLVIKDPVNILDVVELSPLEIIEYLTRHLTQEEIKRVNKTIWEIKEREFKKYFDFKNLVEYFSEKEDI